MALFCLDSFTVSLVCVVDGMALLDNTTMADGLIFPSALNAHSGPQAAVRGISPLGDHHLLALGWTQQLPRSG